MEEKEKPNTLSKAETVNSVAPADQPLNTVLERLPTQFRQEILKQYDLPNVKVSIFTIFKYGTPMEYALQFLGILMAIAAGTYRHASRADVDY